MLPPGPTSHPAVLTARYLRDPHALLEECAARYGDVFTLRFLGLPPAVTVNDPSSSLPGGSWSVQQVANDLVLRFQPGAASPYDTWASGQGLTGLNSAFDLDADGDGVPNGVEFVLDGAPLNAGNAPVINASVSGTTLSLSFLRRDDAAALIPVVEASTTLAAGQWTPLVNGVNGVTVQVTPNGAAPDLVVYNVPLTSFPVRFARLRVTR